ncbi:hypothetical protein J4G08_18145 [Candidatus Poribacteria bacterium]|nr:hypothetical protein [Candidatus Poribacteria bacterium]
MLKSKLFWTSFLLCVIAFCGILFYRTNQQPQEPRKIYNTIKLGQRNTSQIADNPTVRTNDELKETDVGSTPANSAEGIDAKNSNLRNASLSKAEAQDEKSISSNTEAEVSSALETEEEHFYGLTLDEIEQQIPVLEQEIRTNLTKAVELYTELSRTDGMAAKSAEIAAWRDKTWKEVRQLFYSVSRTGKIMRYTSFLKVTGEEQNPTLPGGWIYKLMEPLPMRVTVGTSQ